MSGPQFALAICANVITYAALAGAPSGALAPACFVLGWACIIGLAYDVDRMIVKAHKDGEP